MTHNKANLKIYQNDLSSLYKKALRKTLILIKSHKLMTLIRLSKNLLEISFTVRVLTDINPMTNPMQHFLIWTPFLKSPILLMTHSLNKTFKRKPK